MFKAPVVWFVLCIAVATAMLLAKQQVQTHEDLLKDLRTQIVKHRNAIEVLKAEWAYLTRPQRLEKLGREHLGMVSPMPEQNLDLEHHVIAHKAATSAVREIRKAAPARDSSWVAKILDNLRKE